MDQVNTRRGFLKGFGIISAVVAGASVTHAANSMAKGIPSQKQDISHLAPPSSATTLMITGSYEEKEQQQDVLWGENGNSFYIKSSFTSPSHSVAMTVGKDNRLWMKVNDQWQRVALES